MPYLNQLDPIALHLPSFSLGGNEFHPAVHWYGIAYGLAFVIGWWLGAHRVKQGRLPGINAEALSDLMFYSMVGVVLGGRIGYILFYDLPVYLAHPLNVFKVWEGGMSFHGGLLGVVIAALWWSRRHRLHFFDTVDFLAPLGPPGLFTGRVANFINGELWGKYTGTKWGVIFPSDPGLAKLDAATLKSQYAAGLLDHYARHPSQLYEAALEGLVLFAVLWWYSRKPRPRYAVSGLFALLYGAFRFLIEFVRVPDEQLGYLLFGWMTMGQILCLPLIALGVFWLWLSRRSPTLRPALA